MSDSESPQPTKRRRSRKGLEKQYRCEEPNCGKMFTRLEHLSRHQLNHRPKEIFYCPWPSCGKTFVREDLKSRHLDRHRNRFMEGRVKKKVQWTEADFAKMREICGMTRDSQPVSGDSTMLQNIDVKMDAILSDNAFFDVNSFSGNSGSAVGASAVRTSEGLAEANVASTATAGNLTYAPGPTGAPADLTNKPADEPLDLISWLFSDSALSNTKDPLLSPSLYTYESPGSSHHSHGSPHNSNGGNVQEELTLSESKRLQLLEHMPLLQNNENCSQLNLERYIARYWAYMHPQYPILHKATFVVSKCPDGLLWSIILLGASLDKAHDFASKIATSLRWLLFGSADFDPPSKLWVLQALVLLECFEKTMSKRKLHERAHIHHATTLQLLRRGSVLRGYENLAGAGATSRESMKQWIETESAKRVALMAFTLDVFDSVLFSHAMVMSVNEIRLSLPCSENLWSETPGISGANGADMPQKFQTLPFLQALKMTLNKQHVETGPFGRRVLLAGLLSVSIQMQQRDSQVSSLGWDAFRDTWREIVTPALSFWKRDYDSSKSEDDVLNDLQNNSAYVIELYGCTSAFYHLAHMSMVATFLDMQIYAGAPATLNHTIRDADHAASVRKVSDWVNSSYGKLAFWHAIQFLKEMYLADRTNYRQSLYFATCTCPQPDELVKDGAPVPRPALKEMEMIKYNAYNDPVGKRPNAVYVSGIVIWSYAYFLAGAESTELAEVPYAFDSVLNGNEGGEFNGEFGARKFALVAEDVTSLVEEESIHIQAKEDGYAYLYRLAQYTPDQIADAPDKHQTVGLLRMIVSSLRYHHAELVQEGRRLLVHCIDRSLGRSKVKCDYMFSPRAKI